MTLGGLPRAAQFSIFRCVIVRLFTVKVLTRVYQYPPTPLLLES